MVITGTLIMLNITFFFQWWLTTALSKTLSVFSICLNFLKNFLSFRYLLCLKLNFKLSLSHKCVIQTWKTLLRNNVSVHFMIRKPPAVDESISKPNLTYKDKIYLSKIGICVITSLLTNFLIQSATYNPFTVMWPKADLEISQT